MTRLSIQPQKARRMIGKAQIKSLLVLGIVGLIVLVAIAAVISGSAAPKAKQAQVVPGGEKVIALVGDTPITGNDLEREFMRWHARPENLGNFLGMMAERREIVSRLKEAHLLRKAMRDFRIVETKGTYRAIAEEKARLVLSRARNQAEREVAQMRETALNDKERRSVKSVDQAFTNVLVNYMISEGVDASTESITTGQFTRWYINSILFNKDKQYDEFLRESRRRVLGRALIQSTGMRIDEAYMKKMATKEVKARWIFVTAGKKDAAGLRAAEKKALELRRELARAPERFAEVALKESDDSTGKQGGDLGWVQGGWGQTPTVLVEYLLFTTPPGELSPVVLTSRSLQLGTQVGYSFVLVEGIRERPCEPDFNWERDKSLAILSGMARAEEGVGREYLESLNYTIGITYKSLELQYYTAELSGDYTKANTLLRQVIWDTTWPMTPSARAAFASQMANMSEKMEDRVAYLEMVTPYAGRDIPRYHEQIGLICLKNNMRKKALEHFEAAEIMSSDSESYMRKQLINYYKEMGETEKVKRLQKWVEEYEKVPLEEHLDSRTGGQ